MTAHADPATMNRTELIAYAHDLEAKLDALRPDATADARANLRVAFGLTTKEADLLVALADGRLHSKEGILRMLYDERDEPEVKIVDVFVCKIRKKTAGSTISIATVWGTGYRVTDPAPLKRVMAGEGVEHGETFAPAIGRHPGAKSLPHGSIRDSVLAYLRERAVDGVVSVNGRDLANHTLAIGASVALRNLERGGHLVVLRAPRRGGRDRGSWKVRLL